MKQLIPFVVTLFISATAFGQVNLQQLGHLSFGNITCAGVRAYVDGNGNEYGLIGAGNGISIVDVTDPANPTLLFTEPAASSLWREIAVYQHYAYSCTEGGGGITILDLDSLPNSYTASIYTGDGAIAGMIGSAHTVQVFGEYLYIFGSDIGVGGALICHLADPANPAYMGMYDLEYIHDGYVRDDTLYAGEIYAGQFSIIDVTDKTFPVLLATQSTPGNFCHNTWMSDNGEYLFTTDEVGGAPLGSFDIKDIQNIQLVDVHFNDTMPLEEVHNVYVHDDFLVNPSYGSQITIVDAFYPDNLIEIASYPTGSYLCWDADPYLPSGNIIATDVGGGFYVFAPYYVRACYLEGMVTDSITGQPVIGANIEIIGTSLNASSVSTGEYKTGMPAPGGTFDIQFSKPGYITKTVTGVSLSSGNVTVVDAELLPFIITGQVLDAQTNMPVASAKVKIADSSSFSITTTDVNGNFLFNSVNPGQYEITAAYWGYKSGCINTSVGSGPVVVMIEPGIYDDFTFDFGWTITSTATSGIWVRGEPVGTVFSTAQANPDEDSNSDCSDWAFVTGNGGGGANTDDVDDGETVITSPDFDLTSYTDPYINYERWYFIPSTLAANRMDTMFISLNNGLVTEVIEVVAGPSPTNSSWVPRSYRIKDFIAPSGVMQVIVSISDKPGTGNPLEGGFDKFEIVEGPVGLTEAKEVLGIKIYPNPVSENLYLDKQVIGIDKVVMFTVIDITGRVIIEQLSSGNMLDVARLDRGSYVLQVKDQTGEMIGKAKFVRN